MTHAHATTISKSQLVQLYRQAVLSGVPLEKLEQKMDKHLTRAQVTEHIEHKDQIKRAETLKNRLPRWKKWAAALVPLFFISIGVFLVGSAVVPIASYYVTEFPQLQARTLTSPIPPEQVLDVNPVIINQTAQAAGTESLGQVAQPIIIDTELDYTNLSNWFAEASLPALDKAGTQGKGETYILDIPAVKISNAVVTVGGTDLNKSLIHYEGTALPGEMGSPVIFGHSVLRQFYNPSEKNPRRYNSIFSYIMTLKKGDLIYVTKDNVKYTYRVEEKTEVKPTDVHILAQKYDGRKLKLVTCTPEGTYLMRGVITAILVPAGNQ